MRFKPKWLRRRKRAVGERIKGHKSSIGAIKDRKVVSIPLNLHALVKVYAKKEVLSEILVVSRKVFMSNPVLEQFG